MKKYLAPAILLLVAWGAFAVGPQNLGSSHAVNGYDHHDMTISVSVSGGEAGKLFLNAGHSYPLLFSERDRLVSLIQAAARKVDIAIANKTTISIRQEIGSFYTDSAALVSVSFETDGYGASNTIVRINGDGSNAILQLDKKDGQDIIHMLSNLVDDFQGQEALFK